MQWYQKAAEQCHYKAECALADCYYEGIGIKKDGKLAFEWYQRAANQDYDFAMYKLGMCYQYGIGTEKNEKLALHWYELAAGEGLKNAKDALQELQQNQLICNLRI